jgi:hypothetical protein
MVSDNCIPPLMAVWIGDLARQIRNGRFATPLPARKIPHLVDLQ